MYHQAEILALLHSIPWFLDLSTRQMERLANIATICQVNEGDCLFQEADKEDYIYVVLEGEMSIEIHVPSHGQIRIFTAEPLDVVGWSSMTPVARQRTATARALIHTRLVGFHAEGLRKICEDDHNVGYIIMKRLSNVVASRLLTTRLQLMELFTDSVIDHQKKPVMP